MNIVYKKTVYYEESAHTNMEAKKSHSLLSIG